LERDVENSYFSLDAMEEKPMDQLLAITYRIAMGPQQGRKVLTLHSGCEYSNLCYIV